MLYWKKDTLLLATGLSLQEISQVLCQSTTEQELQENLRLLNEKYLKRYLIMKEYRRQIRTGNQKLPLCIVIAGLPGTGKTSLAKELSAALDIGISIGGDALRSSFRSILPNEQNKVFFTSVYNTWKFYGDYSEQNLLLGYKEQSKIMNHAIQRMIADRGIRDGENILVEYLHFLPEHFDKEILTHPSFVPIVLRINDIEIYSERLMSRTNYSHLQSSGERLLGQKDKYLLIQKYQCKEANKYNLKIIDIDDFQVGLDLAFDFIFERLEKIIELKEYNKSIEYIEKIKSERKSI